jgi:uncharacterized protein YndB with AHSA1/START domain
MTTATDRPPTDDAPFDQDFESTRRFTAPPGTVLAALRSPDGISSWWCPATGSAEVGGTLRMASRSGSTMLEADVTKADERQVTWSVRTAPLTPEWVGTTIDFAVEEADGGATLHFRHRGLTPQCDCFDMCDAGWTNALDRLERYVATSRDAYARDSFQATRSIAASPAAVLAALRSPEAITSWWTPTTGSGDDGGTLDVSFFGGDERVVMQVQPAFEGRVAWFVAEAARTTDWVGTTIYFDVAEAGDGSMLYFRHEGLTPELECFDMCHQGWTHYLGSLVAYVEAGQPDDAPDSFQSTQRIGAAPETVLTALRSLEAVAGWWGPAAGSCDPGGTLEVSFLEGRQRIRMHVEPSAERRVVWSVEGAPLTPDWDGTTIVFDVADDGDGTGAVLHFRHQGLTPELECYEMCHEGWTHYMASLVSYVETGQGQPHRNG